MIAGLTPTANLLNNPSRFLRKRSPSPRVSDKNGTLSTVLAENPAGCALPGSKFSHGAQLQITCRVMEMLPLRAEPPQLCTKAVPELAMAHAELAKAHPELASAHPGLAAHHPEAEGRHWIQNQQKNPTSGYFPLSCKGWGSEIPSKSSQDALSWKGPPRITRARLLKGWSTRLSPVFEQQEPAGQSFSCSGETPSSTGAEAQPGCPEMLCLASPAAATALDVLSREQFGQSYKQRGDQRAGSC